jgi:hypothetical protein
MKAITLRNIPPAVARLIRETATRRDTSLNKAVIALIAERHPDNGRPQRRPRLHHDLDRLAGAWMDEEAAAFDEALVAQRAIDPDIWQ